MRTYFLNFSALTFSTITFFLYVVFIGVLSGAMLGKGAFSSTPFNNPLVFFVARLPLILYFSCLVLGILFKFIKIKTDFPLVNTIFVIPGFYVSIVFFIMISTLILGEVKKSLIIRFASQIEEIAPSYLHKEFGLEYYVQQSFDDPKHQGQVLALFQMKNNDFEKYVSENPEIKNITPKNSFHSYSILELALKCKLYKRFEKMIAVGFKAQSKNILTRSIDFKVPLQFQKIILERFPESVNSNYLSDILYIHKKEKSDESFEIMNTVIKSSVNKPQEFIFFYLSISESYDSLSIYIMDYWNKNGGHIQNWPSKNKETFISNIKKWPPEIILKNKELLKKMGLEI